MRQLIASLIRCVSWAMSRDDDLLGDGLDWWGPDLPVAEGLEQTVDTRAVTTVACGS